MTRRAPGSPLLALLLATITVGTSAFASPRAAAQPAKRQTVPCLPSSLRSFGGLGTVLGQLANLPDAALQTARAAERIMRRKANPIPEITLARFRKLTANPTALAASLASGELPQHFRLMYPHRSDPRTTKVIVREVDIHLPSNASAQMREHGGLWSMTNLHGYTSDAIEQEAISNMNGLSGNIGFMTIHPQGIKAYDKTLFHDVRSWNTPTCCGPAQEHQFRDVEFLRALHTTLGKAFALQRKGLTGESNGGFMTYHARRKLGPMFDVYLPVVGTEGKVAGLAKPPKQLAPTYVYLGTRDILVNGLSAFVLKAAHPNDAANNVMKENGSVTTETRGRDGQYFETMHLDANGRTIGAVRHVSGLGFATHFWPGFEHTTLSIVKNAMKEFLLADGKPKS